MNMRINLFLFSICFFASLCFANKENINKSLVRINTTSNAYNYRSPWLSPQQFEKTGTGFIISNNVILTNAHIVSDAVYIEVRRADDITPYQADVKLVDHDCDLALLSINDNKFMEGSLPLHIGDSLDIGETVNVYGFPVGGDEVSLTQGVVSRIEVQEYAHSGQQLLLSQIDAAINPGNSGGPVIGKNGKVIGVATQGYTFGQNIGYMVPIQVLKHFLQGAKEKPYKGFPAIGIRVQIMENPSIREKFKMGANHSGILISKLNRGLKKQSVLKEEDIILSINKSNISNNGTILLKENQRVRADYLISRAFVGDILDFKVLRKGGEVDLKVKLEDKNNLDNIVKDIQYGKSPTYYIFSGFIFQPLSANYIQSFGPDKWAISAPPLLTYYYKQGEISEHRKEIVVLTRVLPDISNLGYQYIRDAVVVSVNGVEISDLQHLIQVVETSKNKYLEIKLFDSSIVVIDYAFSKKRNQSILKRYNVKEDRSMDFFIGKIS
ncbi:MAG: trypsin-like peptidase domain-containing protein [Legionellales bacterium]|nr:trypsin-like peptidase domain-containing protein [Legionellales bacterium]